MPRSASWMRHKTVEEEQRDGDTMEFVKLQS